MKTTYQAATLFCDHASRFLHLTCHVSTGAIEAICAKRAFERDASLANVTIKKFRADNGIFNSAAWKSTCDTLQQTTLYCSVNAHHQNGIAERQIRTIIDRSQTMLLHAMTEWPDVIHVDLWPYALKLAVDLHNSTPGQSGLSPAEIFTTETVSQTSILLVVLSLYWKCASKPAIKFRSGNHGLAWRFISVVVLTMLLMFLSL
jgi:hypothetical protein